MKKIYFSILFIFLTLHIRSQDTIKNLVFEGGGIRGIAYAGALMEMNERKMLDSVEKVAGTSAGAIVATLYAVGYEPEEMVNEIIKLQIKNLADGNWIFIGGTTRLVNNYGWYKGEKFLKWMSDLIKLKTGNEKITFRELHKLAILNKKYKNLYLTGTNLTRQKLEIFSHETYPDMEIRTAVRISMSIPFFYEPVKIDERGNILNHKEKSKEFSIMIDGGVIANFPIQIFDNKENINMETIGFRLDSDDQIICDRENKGLAPMNINGIKDFTGAFYNIVIENLNRSNLTEEDWNRTISISTGNISPRVKRISKEEKNILIENGRRGVREFIKI